MTYQNLGNVTKAGLRGNTVFCIQMHSMKKETLKVQAYNLRNQKEESQQRKECRRREIKIRADISETERGNQRVKTGSLNR